MSEPMAETVMNSEASESSEPQFGEKRPVENGGEHEFVGSRLSKRSRSGPELNRDLKRVAEIVLVLSTMATLRAGKKPSDAEVELMAEARAKLVEICEGFTPKDIVGRDGIMAVIDDLGLNGIANDQRLGFRGPKLTIAEKLSQAKRKMEESKKFVAPSAAHASHPLQTSFTSAVENRGISPTVRPFQSDKPSHLPYSSGGVPASLPPGPVSTTSATYLQIPSNEAKTPMISTGFPANPQGRDSSSVFPRSDRAQSGSYLSNVQVSSSANQPMMNTPPWSVHTQAASSAKSGSEHKLPNNTSASVQGTSGISMSQLTPQASRDQSFRPFTTQTASGNNPGLSHPLQGMNYVQAPSPPNNHNEISRIVQRLLQPQLPDHPTWTPPSRDYMNKAVTCQSCQITINDVDSVLVCDACEKGFHLKCIQSANQRGIPRGEWHCTRCLAISSGKPLPPKYGRVMRSNPPPKATSNTTGVQPSSVKKVGSADVKVNTIDSKANQQKMTANGCSDVQALAQTDSFTSNFVGSVSDSKILHASEMHVNNSSANSQSAEEKPHSGTSLNNPIELESSAPEIKTSKSSSYEERSSESKAEPPCKSSAMVNNNCDDSRISEKCHIVDESESDSKILHASEMHVYNSSANCQSAEEKPLSGTSLNNPIESESAAPQIKTSKSSSYEERSSESKQEPPCKSSAMVNSNYDDSRTSDNCHMVDESESHSDILHVSEMHASNSLANSQSEEEKPLSGTSVNNPNELESLAPQTRTAKSSSYEERTSLPKPEPLFKSSAMVNSNCEDSRTSENFHIVDESEFDSKILHVSEMHVNNSSANSQNTEEKKAFSGTSLNNPIESESSAPQIRTSKSSSYEERSSESKPEPPCISSAMVNSIWDDSRPSDNCHIIDESESDPKILRASEMHVNNSSANGQIAEDKLLSGTSLNNRDESESQEPQIKTSESYSYKERSSESEPGPPCKSSAMVNSNCDDHRPSESCNIVDGTRLPQCPEVSAVKCSDSLVTIQGGEEVQLIGNSDSTLRTEIKQDYQEVANTNCIGSLETTSSSADGEYSSSPSGLLHAVEWIGSVIQVDGKTFYQSCCVDGVTYKLHDHALFHSSHGKLTPSKLQSMWEDSKTGSKWVIVKRCYFPGDLSENVDCPCLPECNEVYESKHDSTVMAGLIRGLCKVLPAAKFNEESERRSQIGSDDNARLHPIFLCNWFYDEAQLKFQPVSTSS